MGSGRQRARVVSRARARDDRPSAGRQSAQGGPIARPVEIVVGLLFALVVSVSALFAIGGAPASVPSPRAELEAAWSAVSASATATAPAPSADALIRFQLTLQDLGLPASVSVERQRLIAYVGRYSRWLTYPVYNPIRLRHDFSRLRMDYDALLTALGTA